MTPENYDPRIDAYINASQPFARPILAHLRDLLHKGCPEVDETIKWSRPFFEYRGAILGNMSAFKQHCSFGFWGEQISAVLRTADAVHTGSMGSLGRLVSCDDLPPEELMLGWIRQAASFIASGNHTSPIAARHRVVKALKTPREPPPEFTAALNRNARAVAAFAAFSPSCRREYIEWIADAKRPETRNKRITTALLWIAAGKQRNWKHQLT